MIKRRALGQHFLTSDLVAELIAENAHIKDTDTVLEVGTGKGILTLYLCKMAKMVISIEKDNLLFLRAKERFSNIKNLRLEHGDAFKTNPEFDIFVSNLPYSQSRRAIEWLAQRRFSHAVIMVQKEFAQKLSYKEGKGRKAVSVIASYCMGMEKLMDVRKEDFEPVPTVDSVILRLKSRHILPRNVIGAVNMLFSFRRKSVRTIAKKAGLAFDSDKRLEDLSDGEIISLAEKIAK
ncbi:MAG: ribose ABC transporter permease [Thaumarchaeota archaeon]|nr:ribose ABC transporter permease [Nitrososphaerota archaeon]